MPRPTQREIDESWDRASYSFDAEDDALLRHVMLDDAPRQGLHQHGDVVKTCHKLWHRDQPLPCQLCAMEEEDANTSDYLYSQVEDYFGYGDTVDGA